MITQKDYSNSTIFSYETVGNSFSIIEINVALKNPPSFFEKAQLICEEKKTHGLLLVLPQEKWCAVYNKDGSHGQFSINGARCAAFHLMIHHQIPVPFVLKVGTETVDILSYQELLGVGKNLGTLGRGFQINIGNDPCIAQEVEVGNPHTLIQVSSPLFIYLTKNNFHIEEIARELKENLRQERNLSFFTEISLNSSLVLFYERGVGHTPCCGSGILALATYALAYQKSLFSCHTQGGAVKLVNLKEGDENKVYLHALVKPISK